MKGKTDQEILLEALISAANAPDILNGKLAQKIENQVAKHCAKYGTVSTVGYLASLMVNLLHYAIEENDGEPRIARAMALGVINQLSQFAAMPKTGRDSIQ